MKTYLGRNIEERGDGTGGKRARRGVSMGKHKGKGEPKGRGWFSMAQVSEIVEKSRIMNRATKKGTPYGRWFSKTGVQVVDKQGVFGVRVR